MSKSLVKEIDLIDVKRSDAGERRDIEVEPTRWATPERYRSHGATKQCGVDAKNGFGELRIVSLSYRSRDAVVSEMLKNRHGEATLRIDAAKRRCVSPCRSSRRSSRYGEHCRVLLPYRRRDVTERRVGSAARLRRTETETLPKAV